MRNPAGSGNSSAAPTDATTGTPTNTTSPRHRPANTNNNPTGASNGFNATAPPITTPAATHRPRPASNNPNGRASTAVAVQFPSSTRCPNGANPTASPISPSTANRLRKPTPYSRSAHPHPPTRHPVTTTGTTTDSTLRGTSA